MDNFDTTNSNYTEPAAEQLPPEEPELSHSDKAVGIFSEPKNTFEKISIFPPKTIDWFLPVLLLLLVVAVTNILMMNDPEIRMQAQEKQLEQIRENFDEAVEKGQMTREQADQQMEQIENRIAGMGMGTTIVITTVSIFVIGFIFFFLLGGIYYLFVKFALKGAGTYTSALVASGLTAYISIVQIIIAAVLAIAFGRLMNDTSVAALMDADRTTYTGWLLAKIDPISIWAYSVLAIGLAKMFKSDSMGKYFALVFGIWLVGGFILFYLAKSIPFLKFFGL